MIIGLFDETGQPYVECQLTLLRLNARAAVRFLVDTGSNVTLLHPFDIRQAGVRMEELRRGSGMIGIGGASGAFQEPAVLDFRDADGVTRYAYRLNVAIAPPQPYNDDFPSLLGMDILSCWYTECDPTNDLIRFTVRRTL